MGSVETRLRDIWFKVIGVSGTGPDDDFFHCGGHSHLALVLVRALNDEFGLTFSLIDVYKNHTLRTQAAMVELALASAI